MQLEMSEAGAPGTSSNVNVSRLAGSAALCLWYVALWIMLGRYWGLQHDAQLYVLQALNELVPDLYANDLYLRFTGSADLTVFPRVAAFFVDGLSINSGPSLLTAVSLAAWFAAAWTLLRRLMDRGRASLAMGLLLVVPIWYGSQQVFRLAEYFLSARPLAEALSLAMLAALVADRKGLAGILAVSAMAMHPLMAFPALLAGICYAFAPVRDWRIAAGALVACVIGTLTAATIFGGTDRLMSGEWLELTRQRSRYLFIDSWSSGDWQTSVMPLATCLLAALVLRPSRLSTLAMAAAIVGAAGLLLTIASSLVPLTLVLQGQPWRWTWIAAFVALPSLVVLLPRLWHGTVRERAVGLVLLAAWLLRDWSSSDRLLPVGAGGLLAIGAVGMWIVRDRMSPRTGSLLVRGGYLLCGLILIALVASVLPLVSRDSNFGVDPRWIQLSVELMRVFPPVAAAIVVLGWAGARSRARLAPAVIALISIVTGFAAWSGAVRAWRQDPLSDAGRAQFAPWRATIPEGSEVFWPEFSQGPWFLLERPSYLSTSQLAGIVFSRSLADEARRRALELAPAVDPDVWFGTSVVDSKHMKDLAFDDVCRASDLEYAVLEHDDGRAIAAAEWPGPGYHVYLYACSGIRAGPGSFTEPGT